MAMLFGRLGLIVILFAGPIHANAQKKLLHLNLKPVPMDVPSRQFFVDSVSDERNINEDIGIIHRVQGADTAIVRLSPSFKDALTDYFKQVIPVAPGQERIIAVVSQCKISDQIIASLQQSSADVAIAFCRLDSGRLYVLEEYSSHQEWDDKDLTNGYAFSLATAINSCIDQFSKSGFRYNTGVGFQGEEKASDPEHDILHCKYRKRGIYSSFTSLRSNTPDDMDVYLEPKKERFTAKETASGKKIETALGVCDGRDIYINTYTYNHYKSAKGIYAKVLETGRYFVWKDRYIPNGEFMGSMVVIGAIGRKITSSTDVIAMDMKTGTIIPITPSSLQKILADDPQLLEKYKASVKNWELPIMRAFLKTYNENHPL